MSPSKGNEKKEEVITTRGIRFWSPIQVRRSHLDQWMSDQLRVLRVVIIFFYSLSKAILR